MKIWQRHTERGKRVIHYILLGMKYSCCRRKFSLCRVQTAAGQWATLNLFGCFSESLFPLKSLCVRLNTSWTLSHRWKSKMKKVPLIYLKRFEPCVWWNLEHTLFDAWSCTNKIPFTSVAFGWSQMLRYQKVLVDTNQAGMWVHGCIAVSAFCSSSTHHNTRRHHESLGFTWF